MKLIRLANKPLWLKSFDPDAGDLAIPYPTGAAVWVDDPRRAMKFETASAAIVMWQKTSTRTPRRPDGRPNRPLSHFTVTIEDEP